MNEIDWEAMWFVSSPAVRGNSKMLAIYKMQYAADGTG